MTRPSSTWLHHSFLIRRHLWLPTELTDRWFTALPWHLWHHHPTFSHQCFCWPAFWPRCRQALGCQCWQGCYPHSNCSRLYWLGWQEPQMQPPHLVRRTQPTSPSKWCCFAFAHFAKGRCQHWKGHDHAFRCTDPLLPGHIAAAPPNEADEWD